MPKIRRQDIPEALLRHLTLRVLERSVSVSELTHSKPMDLRAYTASINLRHER